MLDFLDIEDPAWKLFDIFIKLAEFRADSRGNRFSDHTTRIEAALVIDLELALLEENMPVQWHFTTVHMKEVSNLMCESYYHIYPDLWVTHTWNTLRTGRLLVQQEICNALTDVSGFPHQINPIRAIDYQLSIDTRHRLISDICASIPKYIGDLSALWSSPAEAQKYVLPEYSSSTSNCDHDIPLPTGLYFFVCPLLLAGVMASDIQRNWIIHSSRVLGQITGIQQAFSIAKVLESNKSQSALR